MAQNRKAQVKSKSAKTKTATKAKSAAKTTVAKATSARKSPAKTTKASKTTRKPVAAKPAARKAAAASKTVAKSAAKKAVSKKVTAKTVAKTSVRSKKPVSTKAPAAKKTATTKKTAKVAAKAAVKKAPVKKAKAIKKPSATMIKARKAALASAAKKYHAIEVGKRQTVSGSSRAVAMAAVSKKPTAARALAAAVSSSAASTKVSAPVKGTAGSPKDIAQQTEAAARSKKAVNQRHGFKTNEHVVYPAHGVGRIIGIEEQEIAGMALELFVIHFDKEKLTLRVPTGKLESVGMRKLSHDDIITKSMGILKGRARVKRTMWSRRAQEYIAKINSGDLIQIAEVVRDLYRSEAQPEQSYSERQLYEDALDRMAREVAAVDKLDERSAVQRITEVLSKSARNRRNIENATKENAGGETQAA